MDFAIGDAGPLLEEESGLAARAAWLYHAGSLTQSQVAEKLGITSAKAHRLIARATRAGHVRVFVEGPIGSCIASEQALAERHGLSMCRVVPTIDADVFPLRELGLAAATFLRDVLENDRHRLIGIGHGRTLAAAVQLMPRLPSPNLRLVSLIGGLPRRYQANPFEVIDHFAEKTGADAFLLPVPMFARAAADTAVLRRQFGVEESLRLAAEVSLMVMGIGSLETEAFLSLAGVITPDELTEVRAAGAAGEILGYFYDADGRLVDTPLHDRVVALPLPRARNPRRVTDPTVVAVAGGAVKADAINAVLRSGLLTGLITDELTARLARRCHRYP